MYRGAVQCPAAALRWTGATTALPLHRRATAAASPEEHRIVSHLAAMTTMENSIRPSVAASALPPSLPPSVASESYSESGGRSRRRRTFMTPCLRASDRGAGAGGQAA